MRNVQRIFLGFFENDNIPPSIIIFYVFAVLKTVSL